MSAFKTQAEQVMQQLQELGTISQSPQYLDRRYLTAEHASANQLVANWMHQAGMQTWQDAAANLWGRLASSAVPDAPRLILGSHLDTVPNGGKYDGMLGVLAPIAVAQLLAQQAISLPFHLDIVGFGDEEGSRFGSTLLGSRALVGNWPADWAELTDENNITLAQAMQNAGLDFTQVHQAAISNENLLGYIELHIEQGPVLEHENLPVGIVSAIAGARRFEFTVTGMAGHAGTVPMPLRQDALAAASEMILAVEALAVKNQVVATVGRINNKPNGVNVIAGQSQFSLDIRSASDAQRDEALEHIMLAMEDIAQRRGVQLHHQQTHEADAVSCDPSLQSYLRDAVEQNGIRPFTLPSGAGHDAMAMAHLCPVAMLFTRCDKGISHHPAEAITTADIEVSLQVLFDTIMAVAEPTKQKEVM
ncbi:allantoate amidohydrolase [Salinimonas sediminis]|uniref:Allantoate amidohydrolase n=1 Tax=Salinimonas sediminis TaxID=2303538 RepID=A0A346NKY2_9ALTE|nr:allantoate amidohydrolase [Salinimonas sediminis]AXR06189.1 allantoate amidohydrolase [Salinimonas sediminis]